MIQKIPVTEKIGYALGDMAANFIFQAMLVLQFDFYTHTFGLTPTDAANLFLIVGLGVACLNPVMGMIADRTDTRWGKFRPWLIWTALPFGILGVLTFTTPDLAPGAKLVYAWITYSLLRVVYTMNNVPYASLTAVMTEDPDERTSISSYRQIAANTAGFIIASLAVPMIAFFGRGDTELGYQLTMGMLSVLGIVFFVITFFTTKERIQPDPQQKTSLGQDLADLFDNRAWVILFLVTAFYFIALALRNSVMIPFFRYNAGHEGIFPWFSGFGLGALLLGVACSTFVSIRMGKLRLFIASMLLTAFFTILLITLPYGADSYRMGGVHIDSVSALIVFPSKATAAVIAFEALRQFSFGLSGPILWAMMGDVADYGEWKTGRRASGTVTAAVVFALWAGLALGGAITGWLLSAYDYVEKAATESPLAQTGIVLTGGLYAGLAFLAAAALLFLYPLTSERTKAIATELIERRKSFVPKTAS